MTEMIIYDKLSISAPYPPPLDFKIVPSKVANSYTRWLVWATPKDLPPTNKQVVSSSETKLHIKVIWRKLQEKSVNIIVAELQPCSHNRYV